MTDQRGKEAKTHVARVLEACILHYKDPNKSIDEASAAGNKQQEHSRDIN